MRNRLIVLALAAIAALALAGTAVAANWSN